PSPSSLLLLRLTPRPPRPTLFPYTTLFRSAARPAGNRNPPDPTDRRRGRVQLGVLRRCPGGGRLRGGRARRWLEDRHDAAVVRADRKSTRLNSSHVKISYAVFCLKQKTQLA